MEEKLGYQFKDPALLEQALTHSSYANERGTGPLDSNERLEFLGDSILGLVSADHLFKEHPDLPEGHLTRTRAALVCEDALGAVAKSWGLGEYIKLGHGEERSGGRERVSILADAVEAVLAAIYLDSGIVQVRKTIRRFVLCREEVDSGGRDHKTALQEYVQREPGHILTYELLREEGPDHRKLFVMGVNLDGSQIGTGQGRSKKEAEQSAAKLALERLTKTKK